MNLRGTKKYQGAKWIRREKRLAIYLRDGMACVYCCAAVEDATVLSLDHLRAYSKGGSHDATNLVTCCGRCNSARGNRSVASFVRAVAEYTKEDAAKILTRVRNAARRALDVAAAKELIAVRGGFSAALTK